jgi:hypothetical protein
MLRVARVLSLLALFSCQNKTSTPEARAAMAPPVAVMVDAGAPRDAVDGGVRWSLARPVPLHARTHPATEPLEGWLSTELGTPAVLYDEAGEQRASWLAVVSGSPDVMAFAHVSAADGGFSLGLVVNGEATIWTGSMPLPSTSRLNAFAIPSHRDEVFVCLSEDCSRGSKCSHGHLTERVRRCAWLAPACPGAPGVGLGQRFDRIDHKRKAIVAELFTELPRCTPREGPNPEWVAPRATDGVHPAWLWRGELEVAGCTEPTWTKVQEAQAATDGELTPLALPETCD